MTETFGDMLRKMKVKATEFSRYLAQINTLTNEVLDKTEKLQECINNIGAKQKKTCSVCYTAPPTHAFLPCGHGGICERCAERGKTRNRCFQCRATIDRVVRIYL